MVINLNILSTSPKSNYLLELCNKQVWKQPVRKTVLIVNNNIVQELVEPKRRVVNGISFNLFIIF